MLQCWSDAVQIVCCPVGFRSAAALALRLIEEHTLPEFPDACHIRDLAPVTGLAQAAARFASDSARASAQEAIGRAIDGAFGRDPFR
jgi:hypothetical protein